MRLNLPLGGSYIPSDPWVSKFGKTRNVVIKLFIHAEDVKSLVWCNRKCLNAMRCFASK